MEDVTVSVTVTLTTNVYGGTAQLWFIDPKANAKQRRRDGGEKHVMSSSPPRNFFPVLLLLDVAVNEVEPNVGA